jgi:hypothetical protein
MTHDAKFRYNSPSEFEKFVQTTSVDNFCTHGIQKTDCGICLRIVEFELDLEETKQCAPRFGQLEGKDTEGGIEIFSDTGTEIDFSDDNNNSDDDEETNSMLPDPAGTLQPDQTFQIQQLQHRLSIAEDYVKQMQHTLDKCFFESYQVKSDLMSMQALLKSQKDEWCRYEDLLMRDQRSLNQTIEMLQSHRDDTLQHGLSKVSAPHVLHDLERNVQEAQRLRNQPKPLHTLFVNHQEPSSQLRNVVQCIRDGNPDWTKLGKLEFGHVTMENAADILKSIISESKYDNFSKAVFCAMYAAITKDWKRLDYQKAKKTLDKDLVVGNLVLDFPGLALVDGLRVSYLKDDHSRVKKLFEVNPEIGRRYKRPFDQASVACQHNTALRDVSIDSGTRNALTTDQSISGGKKRSSDVLSFAPTSKRHCTETPKPT